MNRTVTLPLAGMTCDACELAVERALRAVPGVESVKASLADGAAHVVCTASCTDEQLIEAVERAGYFVPNVSTFASAHDNGNGDNNNSGGSSDEAAGSNSGDNGGSDSDGNGDGSGSDNSRSSDSKRIGRFRKRKGRNTKARAVFETRTTSARDAGELACIAVIIIGLLVVSRETGAASIFQAFPTASAEHTELPALFVIGLFTSLHCTAMCGGINLAQSASVGNGSPSRMYDTLRPSLLYNGGRLASYTAIGALCGLVGSALSVTPAFRGLVSVLAGVLMLIAGLGFLGKVSFPRLTSRATAPIANKLLRRLAYAISAFGRRGSFALGLANGFMPCGPLQSMQLYAMSTGSALSGALSMLVFCLGTVPLVLTMGVTASALKTGWRRRMTQVSGCMLIAFGVFACGNGLALSGANVPDPFAFSDGLAPIEQRGTQTAVEKDGVQYLITVVQEDGYDNVQIKAGVPVVWTFSVNDANLNGCNNQIVLTEFNRTVDLSVGETTVTFTPHDAGVYSYGCWMGMLRNTVTVL